MNCKRCNKLLEDQAKFCRHCGLPVDVSPPGRDSAPITSLPPLAALEDPEDEDTVPITPLLVAIKDSEDTVPITPQSVALEDPEDEDTVHITPLYLKGTARLPELPEKDEGHTSKATSPALQIPGIAISKILTQPIPDTSTSSPSLQLSQPSEMQFQTVPVPKSTYARLGPSPLIYYQGGNPGLKLPAAVVNSSTTARKRWSSGCFFGCLSAGILLMLLLAVGWVEALRPYLNSTAQQQIDQTLALAVAQIPPQVANAPSPLRIQESALNNVIVTDTSAGPVQHIQTLFTSQGIQFNFQLYGYPCTITGAPIAVNNRLRVGNITITGIVAQILSPDQVEQLLNKRLSEAQNKLKRSVTDVSLREHELDIYLN